MRVLVVDDDEGMRETIRLILRVNDIHVDAVESVEDGPDRVAYRDVVAMRFPVEVRTDRPEEIVEIRNTIS